MSSGNRHASCCHLVLPATRLGISALLCCMLSPVLLAQSTFGSFTGTVKDPTGRVVPGATVTLTDTGTSATRVEHTNAAGEYTLQNVEPGTYTISVDAPGFSRADYPALALMARETRRLDASMVVGAESQR